MNLAPALVKEIRSALQRFITLAPDFYPSTKNQESLFAWLRGQTIPENQWVSEHIFSAAFMACRNQLQTAPPEEDPAVKRHRLAVEKEMRDRHDGRLKSHSVEQETPFEEMRRLLKEKQTRIEANKKATQEEIAAAAVKAKSDADFSGLPSVAEMADGTVLTPQELRVLSREKVKEYVRREGQAQLEKYRRQREGQ